MMAATMGRKAPNTGADRGSTRVYGAGSGLANAFRMVLGERWSCSAICRTVRPSRRSCRISANLSTVSILVPLRQHQCRTQRLCYGGASLLGADRVSLLHADYHRLTKTDPK